MRISVASREVGTRRHEAWPATTSGPTLTPLPQHAPRDAADITYQMISDHSIKFGLITGHDVRSVAASGLDQWPNGETVVALWSRAERSASDREDNTPADGSRDPIGPLVVIDVQGAEPAGGEQSSDLVAHRSCTDQPDLPLARSWCTASRPVATGQPPQGRRVPPSPAGCQASGFWPRRTALIDCDPSGQSSSAP